MFLRSSYFYLGAVLIFVSTNNFAQITTNQVNGGLNTITTAVPFLLIAPDSRAGGMGEAGVASAPDVNSMHWNPSKYAFYVWQYQLRIR